MNSDIEQLASLAHSQLAHNTSEPAREVSNGTKRKTEAEHTPSGKSKRSRYISLACNECKRRKIKCNGQTPCQRCGNLNLECLYAPNCCAGFKDSQEYKDLSGQIALLQEQVNMLYENINGLRTQLGQHTPLQQPLLPSAQHQHHQQPTSIDPSLQTQTYNDSTSYGSQTSPSAARPRSQAHNHSTFRGLSSTEFNLGVAKDSPQITGVQAQESESTMNFPEMLEGMQEGDERLCAQRHVIARLGQMHDHIHESKDPIWVISHEEAVRLCHVFKEETQLMYPVLDVDKIIPYVHKLFSFLAALRRSGLMQQGMPGADAVEDESTNVLKMLLAIALTVENGGRSELGKRFFDAVQPTIDNLLLGDVNVNSIRLLVMTAVYEIQHDNESKCWRLIGLAARLCIELGLHRTATYAAIEDEAQRAETILLFWTCYVLDRRWSLGTGMLYALQDADIDPALPRPGERSPYLMAMIKCGEIGGKMWHSLAATSSTDHGAVSPISLEKMKLFDDQVVQWQRSLTPSLQYDPTEQSGHTADSLADRARLRSRLVIHLRANQMRILIHRPILHSALAISQHRDLAEEVIDIAKDTIRVLTTINRLTDLYRTQQVIFHAFLTSALAVLFLAISHTPAYFASEVREEFYMALDLIRGFSKDSLVSKRLWRTIQSLKENAPKLGLTEQEASIAPIIAQHENQRTGSKSNVDPSRSAAVAMAGLAGHNVDETALFDGDNPETWSPEVEVSGNPTRMANDLARLFEAAGDIAEDNKQPDEAPQGAVRHTQSQTERTVNHDSRATAFGEDALSSLLKDLF